MKAAKQNSNGLEISNLSTKQIPNALGIATGVAISSLADQISKGLPISSFLLEGWL